MSLRSDERLLAAVAAALGESIAFIRRRGFHLDVAAGDLDPWPVRPCARQAPDEPDDTVDIAAWGVDWDADDECRVRCRPRRSKTRWQRRAA